jgi:signal transduction histidine kinase
LKLSNEDKTKDKEIRLRILNMPSGESFQRRSARHFRRLSHKLLSAANKNLSRYQFLRRVTNELLNFSECDSVELRLVYSDKTLKCESRKIDGPAKSEFISSTSESKSLISSNKKPLGYDLLIDDILKGSFDGSKPFFTKAGSFWSGDSQNPFLFRGGEGEQDKKYDLKDLKDYRSLLVIPLKLAKQIKGVLGFKSNNEYFFTQEEIAIYEDVAQFLTIALDNQEAQYDLKERVKELSCLYGFARLAQDSNISLNEFLQGVARLLPPAFQYPHIAASRISMDGEYYSTPAFNEDGYILKSDIIVGNKVRGTIAVSYSKEMKSIFEGPFLKEEGYLLSSIAAQIVNVVEQREARNEKLKLQDQLRHADRLATIGQLAAGVAHELNEPLSTILGFAQLIKKNAQLQYQSEQDIEKIVKAALHAREVVRKLVTFAKQTPPKNELIDLNAIIQDGLYFFESRLKKGDIELVNKFADDLPEIFADPSQLYQVIINLVVNALQAMPGGGKIYISTAKAGDYVSLTVEDTGIGMNEETMEKLFIPFFTTKDVGEGTGLGLAVVHGIITAHDGTIRVSSKIGKGTRFEIRLPLPENGQ